MESMEARFRTHHQQRNSCCSLFRWCLLVLGSSPESRVPRPGRTQARPFGVLCPGSFVPDATTAYGTLETIVYGEMESMLFQRRPDRQVRTKRSSGLDRSSSWASVFFLEAPHCSGAERVLASHSGWDE